MNGDTLDQKVDRILHLLEGEQHAPGLLQRLDDVETVLRGKDGGFGLVTKVNIMWRGHLWLVGVGGGLIGWCLKTYLH